MEENAEFFDVLMKAVRRETAAFNYYHRASEKSPSEKTKSLLVQLTEEETGRRFILKQAYQNVKRLLSDKTPQESHPGRGERERPSRLGNNPAGIDCLERLYGGKTDN